MYKLDKISSTCGFSKIPNPIPLSSTTRQAQVPVGLAKCQAQSIGFRYMLSPNAYKFDMVSNPPSKCGSYKMPDPILSGLTAH